MVCPVLLIAVAAWAVAQVLKLLIATAVYRKFDITYLTTGGGDARFHPGPVLSPPLNPPPPPGGGGPPPPPPGGGPPPRRIHRHMLRA